jgi:hypothetical protein
MPDANAARAAPSVALSAKAIRIARSCSKIHPIGQPDIDRAARKTKAARKM